MSENIKLNKIDITSKFWNRYRELVPKKILPYQWSVINDQVNVNIAKEPGGPELGAEDSHAVANLEIAAHRKKGNHVGYTFQDTDVYKWLEAAAYSLSYHYDDELKSTMDDVVNLIYEAQDDDGYLVSYFQIEEPQRKFKRLSQSHELYTMGHYIEAAVAYYNVTHSEKALLIATRMADCINQNFGPEEGKIHGADGHPEVELALARLYEVTKNTKYIELADYLIEVRGQDPEFFQKQQEADGIDNDLIDGMTNIKSEYLQADSPVIDQKSLQGHAVRVVYLCTGIAHVARITHNRALLDACQRFWNNIVNKRMYLTGGIGSTNLGEEFTMDYDLPNDTMYGETCASVGMSFFARQMFEIESDGKYGDVLERELYNGALSGISLDGTHFFYVNPLEADPDVSKNNPSRAHVINQRAEWFGVACCPSNITRLIASVEKYIYKVDKQTIFSDQFIANEADFNHGIKVKQDNNYPWEKTISFSISNSNEEKFEFAIRIPNWSSEKFSVLVDGEKFETKIKNGFVYIPINSNLTNIELNLDFDAKLIQANNNIRYDANKLALQRGPLVYCTEQVDNDTELWKLNLDINAKPEVEYKSELLNGIDTIRIAAKKDVNEDQDLYAEYHKKEYINDKMTFIPYYSWANRGSNRMSVWQNYVR